MNTAWLSPRRWSAGLWGIALLSALVVPFMVHVAGPHQTHWLGTQSPDWWTESIIPWSARLQALVGVVAVGGWAAWSGPPMPDRRRAVIAGAASGLGGAAVALLAAAPPWF